MNEESGADVRLTIEPTPSDVELVVILTAWKQSQLAGADEAPLTPSRWAAAGRREAMRAPLSDERNGWNR